MESNKTALGMLVGVAVGALIGMLFAPEAGTKTRRRILDKGQNYVDELKDKFDTLYEDVSEKYEGFVEEAKNMTSSKQV